jgi:hypothetical protein
MDAKTLRASPTPPEGASAPLTAMWHAAKGEWDKAHALVQDEVSKEAAWVHAHLHRMEGDGENAAYWYGKAGKGTTDAPLDQEWHEIAEALALMR